jgi:hypothetical protein
MKTLTKIEKVKRWLESGKALTQQQAIDHFNYYRLADAIHKLRDRGMWIIDIGKPGQYSKYLQVERGTVKNLMVIGHRIEIVHANYINGLSDMAILICASNGRRGLTFRVQSDAFRDQEIMKKAIQENLKKVR